MDNKTSRQITHAKGRSRNYHLKGNTALYKEYTASSDQYLMTFVEWKKKNRK